MTGGTAAESATVGLSARLMALARMIQIGAARAGPGGFSGRHLSDAEQVLSMAGERLRLSADHTVVVLAGGTGSGKSSLFNKLAGADFSVVGVTRPVTREPHACVWTAQGAGPLLDWLGVPPRNMYVRASALDAGENDLAGMVLVDLPDHDSVLTAAGGVADRISARADLLVWVLDPQKYADAAVHRDYLVPMAGHSEVLAVVLNQADLLAQSEVDDCVSDLRRLLETEALQDAQVLVTSAVNGAGIDDLRKVLVSAVNTRQATATRISADVDRVARRFARYGGGLAAPAGPEHLPASSEEQLADAFAQAAGVNAVVRSWRSALELRAVDFVGWPVAWLVQRLARRTPARQIRLRSLQQELRSASAGLSGLQQAEIDNALTDLCDDVAGQLPRPWARTVAAAIRSGTDQIPVALGTAIAQALPAESTTPWWWRLAGAWQGMLMGAAAVGVAWLAAVFAVGVLHAVRPAPAVLSDSGLMPWIAAAVAADLLLGWLTSLACMTWVRSAAQRDADGVEQQIRLQIAAVVQARAIAPAEQELAELGRFRDELAIAAQADQAAAVQQPAGAAAPQHPQPGAGQQDAGTAAAAQSAGQAPEGSVEQGGLAGDGSAPSGGQLSEQQSHRDTPAQAVDSALPPQAAQV